MGGVASGEVEEVGGGAVGLAGGRLVEGTAEAEGWCGKVVEVFGGGRRAGPGEGAGGGSAGQHCGGFRLTIR